MPTLQGCGFYVAKLISQPGLRCTPFIPLTPQSFPATGGTGAIIISYPPVGCGQIPVSSTAGPTPWLRYCPECSGGADLSKAIGFTVDASQHRRRPPSEPLDQRDRHYHQPSWQRRPAAIFKLDRFLGHARDFDQCIRRDRHFRMGAEQQSDQRSNLPQRRARRTLTQRFDFHRKRYLCRWLPAGCRCPAPNIHPTITPAGAMLCSPTRFPTATAASGKGMAPTSSP